MLNELQLLPVYDSSEYDLIQDLQVPLLKNSVDYLRGVGFFTSGWLRLASYGLTDFIQHGGKARVVLSPILEKKDWDALQLGDKAKFDAALKSVLADKIDDIQSSLENDTLNILAWMVADEVLNFRFAIPRQLEYPGNYHDKIGIFKDEIGNAVAIHGSLNDSIQGSLNGEAFSVFQSWIEGQKPYCEKHIARLEALWNNENSMFRVSEIAQATKQKIIELRTTSDRPYPLPGHSKRSEPTISPHCSVSLYTFQQEAIHRWKESNYRGIFEMATGTGKTITSLAAAVERYNELGRLSLVILVPYLHLLEQWQSNCRKFGFDPVLCSGQHENWQIRVKAQIQDFNLGTKRHICIIAVHATAATARFQEAVAKLIPKFTMLIGDEVHALGAKKLRNALIVQAESRLGLSATPKRWFDDEGTSVIFTYFGQTCFEFSIEQAIGRYLTPYRYYPQLVSLTDQESSRYQTLTLQVSRLHSQSNDIEVSKRIKYLLLQRAKIISSAEEKLPALVTLLKAMIKEDTLHCRETSGTLIYCAPGSHRAVLQEVARLGLRCHEFVHEVSLTQREKLLSQFGNGDIQVLVAMKCLDEGVDVPSTRQAFVLASSTNPREFVQRRGRILRMADNKKESIVFDYIVVPPPPNSRARNTADINILKREMPRFVEFATSSLNEFEARACLRDLLDSYGMLNLLDEKPWDVYHSLKEWDWETDE